MSEQTIPSVAAGAGSVEAASGGAKRRYRSALVAAVCASPLLALGGCLAFPSLTTNLPQRTGASSTSGEGAAEANAAESPVARRGQERLTIPGASPPAPSRQPATDAQIEALVPDEPVNAALAPQPLPQFAAAVFGLLDVPYTLTADVASRTEVIAGGTGGTISKRALFRLTQQAFKQYGVDVFIEGGGVMVGSSPAAQLGSTFSRSRSTPTVAGNVVQFFPVQTIQVQALRQLVSDLFPNLGGVRVTVDQDSNSFLLSGLARDVGRLVEALKELDQPRYAGSEILRIEPVYLSADQLSKALVEVLTTEGYIVSPTPQLVRPISIVPVLASNQLLVFARDPAVLERVNFWVANLDRPATLGDRATTFVYQARNIDAESLGRLAMGQAPASSSFQPPTGVPGSAPAGTDNASRANATTGGGTGSFLGGRLLVDPAGNRILFTGTATDYAQLRGLLTTLDIAAPQVVIEVMIAEVTLTDATSLGVNLFGTDARGDGLATGSTEGIAIGAGALNLTFVGPDYRAQLVANASNNRVNILQRPQLVARSGGTARFQVGTDVPIITSQSASDSQSGGSTDILQSVQYRQTGTILEITPVVYGDRVDLTISQELSSAGDSPEGISSPTILNRSLSTQIAVRDGWTGVLGGLIGNNYTKNNSGVPFLKDVPLIGSAFQNNRVTGERTELLLLITPYIVRGDEDMAEFAALYSGSMNAAFRTGRGWSYTLTPWSISSRFRGLGFDLPSPLSASETPSLIPRRGRPASDAASPAAPTVEPIPGDPQQ